jgi:hypothetical protein
MDEIPAIAIRGEEIAKKQGVSQGVKSRAKLASDLGPDTAEHPLTPYYRTQNHAKRFNKLDNWNCFGTRGSEVQILSPRPFLFGPARTHGLHNVPKT